MYSIDPGSQSPTIEKVAFGIDNDVDNLIKAKGEMITKVDHRLESRIFLLVARFCGARRRK